MKYIVTCTRIFNGTIEVEAQDEDDAIEMARERFDEIDFDYGETTADYAEPAEEEEG